MTEDNTANARRCCCSCCAARPCGSKVPTAQEIADEMAKRARTSQEVQGTLGHIQAELQRIAIQQLAPTASPPRHSPLPYIAALTLALAAIAALGQAMISPERVLIELSKYDKSTALVSMDDLRITYCAIDISLALAIMFVAAASLRAVTAVAGRRRVLLKELAIHGAAERAHWSEVKSALDAVLANTAAHRSPAASAASGAGTAAAGKS